MKKVISVFLTVFLLCTVASAQRHGPRGKEDGWRERVRAEKVAFLTGEIDLSESEAQAFWPIYNELQKEQREGYDAVKAAYDAMEKGVKDGKSGKEMEKLVDDYVNAKKSNDEIATKYRDRLMKVLPAEKVARYYVAEEQFRHQQIGRLGSRQGFTIPYPQFTEEQRQSMREFGEHLKEQFQKGTHGQRQKDSDSPAQPMN